MTQSIKEPIDLDNLEVKDSIISNDDNDRDNRFSQDPQINSSTQKLNNHSLNNLNLKSTSNKHTLNPNMTLVSRHHSFHSDFSPTNLNNTNFQKNLPSHKWSVHKSNYSMQVNPYSNSNELKHQLSSKICFHQFIEDENNCLQIDEKPVSVPVDPMDLAYDSDRQTVQILHIEDNKLMLKIIRVSSNQHIIMNKDYFLIKQDEYSNTFNDYNYDNHFMPSTPKIRVNGIQLLLIINNMDIQIFSVIDLFKKMSNFQVKIEDAVKVERFGKYCCNRPPLQAICFFHPEQCLLAQADEFDPTQTVIEWAEVDKLNDEDQIGKTLKFTDIHDGINHLICDVDQYKILCTPRFINMIDVHNKVYIIPFDFSEDASCDIQEDFYTGHVTSQHIWHIEYSEVQNTETLNLALQQYEPANNDRIYITQIPIDLTTMTFSKRQANTQTRKIKSSIFETISFGRNQLFQDQQYHALRFWPEFQKREDLVNSIIMPQMILKTKKENCYNGLKGQNADLSNMKIGRNGYLYQFNESELFITKLDEQNNFRLVSKTAFDNDLMGFDLGASGDRIILVFDNFIIEVQLLNESGRFVRYQEEAGGGVCPVASLILLTKSSEEDQNQTAHFCQRDHFLSVNLDIAREMTEDVLEGCNQANHESLVLLFSLTPWGRVLAKLPFNYRPLDRYNVKEVQVAQLYRKDEMRTQPKNISRLLLGVCSWRYELEKRPVLMIVSEHSVVIFLLDEEGQMLSTVPIFYSEYKVEILSVILHPFLNFLYILTEEFLYIQQFQEEYNLVNLSKTNKYDSKNLKVNEVNLNNNVQCSCNCFSCCDFSSISSMFKQKDMTKIGVIDFKKIFREGMRRRFQKETEFLVIESVDAKWKACKLSSNGKLLVLADNNLKISIQALKGDGRLLSTSPVQVVDMNLREVSTCFVSLSLNMKFLLFASSEGVIHSHQISEERRVAVHSGQENGRFSASEELIRGCIDRFQLENNVNSKIKTMSLNPTGKFLVQATEDDNPQMIAMLDNGRFCNDKTIVSIEPHLRTKSLNDSASKTPNKHKNSAQKLSLNKNSNFKRTSKSANVEYNDECEIVHEIRFDPVFPQVVAVGQEDGFRTYKQDTHTGKIDTMLSEVNKKPKCKKLQFSRDAKFIVAFYETDCLTEVQAISDPGKLRNKMPLESFKLPGNSLITGMLTQSNEYILIAHGLIIEMYPIKFDIVEEDEKPKDKTKQGLSSNPDANRINMIRDKETPQVKMKVEFRAEREQSVLDIQLSPDGKFIFVCCNFNQATVYQLNDTMPTLVETVVRMNKGLKSISIYQPDSDYLQQLLMIADENSVSIQYIEDGKNIQEDPILNLKFNYRVTRAMQSHDGENLLIALQKKEELGYVSRLESYQLDQLLLQSGSQQAMNERLEDQGSLKYASYKLLKYFIALDMVEQINYLTETALVDFFYLEDSCAFNLALQLKNVQVMKVFFENLIRKRDQGSLCMLYEFLVQVIDQNEGENKDEFIMNFLRSFIATTSFLEITHFTGYISSTHIQVFEDSRFDDNECWFHIEDLEIRRSKIRSSSQYQPIIHMSNIKILKMLDEDERIEIFNNQGVRSTIDKVWDKIMQYVFIPQLAINCIKFVSNILLAVSVSLEIHQIIEIVPYQLIVLSLLTLFQELNELFKKGCVQFEDTWNWVEMFSGTFEVTTSILAIQIINTDHNESLEEIIRFMTSTTLFFNLFVVLKLLRGFDDQSWLVRTILQNFMDIQSFMMIMSIFCGQFAMIFMAIQLKDPGDHVGHGNITSANDAPTLLNAAAYGGRVSQQSTVQKSIVSTLKIIFGKFDVGIFDETINRQQAFILFLVINMVQVVIMLNTLIAILADSYSKVKENQVSQGYKQKLNLIIDQFDILPQYQKQDVEETIGVIKLVAPLNSFVEEQDNHQSGGDAIEGQLKNLRKEVLEKIKTSGKKTGELINGRINKLESRFGKAEIIMNNINRTITQMRNEHLSKESMDKN